MKAAIEAMSNKEMGSYKASRFFVTCLAPHSPTKCNPWIKLAWGPPKHSVAMKLKNDSVQTQGDSSSSTKLAESSENAS
jgi:hypothetical protein